MLMTVLYVCLQYEIIIFEEQQIRERWSWNYLIFNTTVMKHSQESQGEMDSLELNVFRMVVSSPHHPNLFFYVSNFRVRYNSLKIFQMFKLRVYLTKILLIMVLFLWNEFKLKLTTTMRIIALFLTLTIRVIQWNTRLKFIWI